MRVRRLNIAEILAALAFVGLGAFMLWQASGYPYGEIRRMGPGFFPVWIGVVLVGFGVALVLEVRHLKTPVPPVAFRPLLAIPFGLLGFALLVERAGLVPATMLLIAASTLGDRPFRPRAALLTTVAVTALAYLILIRGLGMPLDAFAW